MLTEKNINNVATLSVIGNDNGKGINPTVIDYKINNGGYYALALVKLNDAYTIFNIAGMVAPSGIQAERVGLYVCNPEWDCIIDIVSKSELISDEQTARQKFEDYCKLL